MGQYLLASRTAPYRKELFDKVARQGVVDNSACGLIVGSTSGTLLMMGGGFRLRKPRQIANTRRGTL